jgi:4-hydroxybenzoate polyprenyltransferase
VLSILKLIRLPNLLIIALTLYAFRFMVVKPYYGMSGTDFQMDPVSFGLMTAITMLIAAAGYLGNDHFDTGIDRINRPGRLSVAGKIPGKSLIAMGLLFSLVSILGILVLAIRMSSVLPAIVLLVALVVVWWYAGRLKKSFVWGNLAVCFMSSLTLGMAWLFEWFTLNRNGIHLFETKPITILSSGICFFAFMLTFIREIIKDAEDIEGDKAFGCRSIPIVKGPEFTKRFVGFLTFLLFGALVCGQYWLFTENFKLVVIWLIPFVEIPLLLFLFRVKKASANTDYSKLSRLLKWIMVGGIASMAVIWLNFRF